MVKDYIRCINKNCNKIIGVIDEVEYCQFGMPERLCEDCMKKANIVRLDLDRFFFEIFDHEEGFDERLDMEDFF